MLIITLGSAGFIPTNGKETSCFLTVINDTAILFDAGTGVKNLLHPKIQKILSRVECLHVIFSHFHHDHTAGFTWLLRLWQKELRVYVPSLPLINTNGIDALVNLTSSPYFGFAVNKWKNVTNMVEISNFEIDINDLNIKIIKQHHSGGSIGFRVNDFAYITDVEVREMHTDFIQDCELLFVDTMHDQEDFLKMNISYSKPAQHGYSIGNAKMAKQSNVKRMGLIHIDPLYNKDRINNLISESRTEFSNTFIAEELQIIEI